MKKTLYEIINTQSNDENAMVLANMDKIASETGVTHRAVNNLINKYKNELKESSPVKFQIAPDSTHKKTYFLDSAQCAFIITRMNSKGATKLQKQISNVFAYKIRQQLARQAVHQLSKGTVKSFSNAIKLNLDSPNGHMYVHITDLAYKLALGVGVRKIQALRGAKGTSNKKDYLSSHEIELLNKAMNNIELLLNLGYGYYDIKQYVSNHCLNKAQITVKLGGAVHE